MKVLVVDDELPICELLDEFLSEQGFQVSVATNGEEALALFEQESPQMVLLDIKMPGMDGMDVLRRIKEIDSGPGVIMISAFGDSSIVTEALQKGANHYMEKPIELKRLSELLVEWQSSAAGVVQNEIG
jgi:two-component system response regulator (stage 0 sporulation protein F)